MSSGVWEYNHDRPYHWWLLVVCLDRVPKGRYASVHAVPLVLGNKSPAPPPLLSCTFQLFLCEAGCLAEHKLDVNQAQMEDLAGLPLINKYFGIILGSQKALSCRLIR